MTDASPPPRPVLPSPADGTATSDVTPAAPALRGAGGRVSADGTVDEREDLLLTAAMFEADQVRATRGNVVWLVGGAVLVGLMAEQGAHLLTGVTEPAALWFFAGVMAAAGVATLSGARWALGLSASVGISGAIYCVAQGIELEMRTGASADMAGVLLLCLGGWWGWRALGDLWSFVTWGRLRVRMAELLAPGGGAGDAPESGGGRDGTA